MKEISRKTKNIIIIVAILIVVAVTLLLAKTIINHSYSSEEYMAKQMAEGSNEPTPSSEKSTEPTYTSYEDSHQEEMSEAEQSAKEELNSSEVTLTNRGYEALDTDNSMEGVMKSFAVEYMSELFNVEVDANSLEVEEIPLLGDNMYSVNCGEYTLVFQNLEGTTASTLKEVIKSTKFTQEDMIALKELDYECHIDVRDDGAYEAYVYQD